MRHSDLLAKVLNFEQRRKERIRDQQKLFFLVDFRNPREEDAVGFLERIRKSSNLSDGRGSLDYLF